MPDCWLEVIIRKVLRPVTSTQVFLGFTVPIKQMLRWFPRFQVATTCFLCSPPDLNLVVKLRRMRWAGHVVRMGEERGVYRVLEGETVGKETTGET